MRKLLEVLHRLTDLGNTVIIIEHNLDIIRNADYILDMGPEGGEGGGRVIAHGTPEQISTVAASHTGSFLAKYYASLPEGVTLNGAQSHAGPQPLEIVAAEDKKKEPRGKFVAPEKKTGVPTARAMPEPMAKKKVAKKAAKKAVGRPKKV